MVTPKKDADIFDASLGSDFDFFLEHREEFMKFMELDADVVEHAFDLQELLTDDAKADGNKFFERFINYKTAGFSLLQSMANVMVTNVESKNEGAVKVLSNHINVLNFYTQSRLKDRGLCKPEAEDNKIKIDIKPNPNLSLDGELKDPGDEEPGLLQAPKLSTLDQDDMIFHLVTESGFRIEVYPSSLDYYMTFEPDSLGNCWICDEPSLTKYPDDVVFRMIRYTQNRILPMGEFTVDVGKEGSIQLLKVLDDDKNVEKNMPTVNVKIQDACEFLRNPKVRIERKEYVDAYGKVPQELIIRAEYSNTGKNRKISLGRWQLNQVESDNWTLVFRPVKKTRKGLVQMIRRCFPNLLQTDAQTAFSYYLQKQEKNNKPIVSSKVEKPVEVPEHIPKMQKCNETVKLHYYDRYAKAFKDQLISRVNMGVLDNGAFIIFSDVTAIDWKGALKFENTIAKLTMKASSYEISNLKTNRKFLTKSLYEAAGKPTVDTKGIELEGWFRISSFDEGVIFTPCDPEEKTEVLHPDLYPFDSLHMVCNGVDYYPNNDFYTHSIDDLDGNAFYGFCTNNLQNWEKYLDHEDFIEDAENTDTIQLTLDSEVVGTFDEVYVIGDYVFMFRGDKESLVYKEGLYHMSMYEQVYYLFKSTKPTRKGKLGQATTIQYYELKRKTSTVSPDPVKNLVRPPKRKTSRITF
jgi:hypothetical protein